MSPTPSWLIAGLVTVLLSACATTMRPRAAPAAQPTSIPGPAAAATGSLWSFLEHEADINGLPSVTVVVADRNGILDGGSVGFADRKEHRHADFGTYYRIGSLTKLITNAALLSLRDEGKLTLDDPVSKFIPEIEDVVHPPGDQTPILIRHLLTHRSGLERDCPRSKHPNATGPDTEVDLLDCLEGQKLLFVPGSAGAYSNQGMALVGLIVSRAANMPYRLFIQKRVLDPLEMHCVWDDVAVPPHTLAQGYPLGSEEAEPGYRHAYGIEESAGGLYCSARDLATFASLFLHTHEGEDERVLSTRSRREALEQGLNWSCQGPTPFGRICGHAGLIDDYGASLLLFFGRHRAIITLTNAAAEDPAQRIGLKVASGLFGGVPWSTLETPPVPVFVDDARAHLEAVLAGPVTPDVVEKHLRPEEVRAVGGVESVVRKVGDMVSVLGTCQVESLKPAGATGEVLAVMKCSREDHRERCTMAQESDAPHRIGLFLCNVIP
jgi:CubicO group peptidase (beta-lactamase class C family)